VSGVFSNCLQLLRLGVDHGWVVDRRDGQAGQNGALSIPPVVDDHGHRDYLAVRARRDLVAGNRVPAPAVSQRVGGIVLSDRLL
jgi:hypothetical protein